MVDTYHSDQEKFYYVTEGSFGVVPASPAMLGHSCSNLDPDINPNNIKVAGSGSVDVVSLKRGLRQPLLKLKYPIPSDAPINLLQYVKQELNASLSLQVLYYKDIFVTATDIISLLYKGARFNKATLTCDIDGILECEAEFPSQDVEVTTAKIANANYTEYTGAVSGSESYVKIGGVACERITSWKLQIDNSCKAVPVIRSTNGHLAKYLTWGKRLLTGELTFEFESKQEADEILADTEQTSLEFGLGGANKVSVEHTKWDDFSLSGKAEDLIYAKVTFTARGPLSIL
ncbi:MAG: phage tail tube protein [Candidatus Bathyarchaeota archaeon]|nr:phage tail tube protein [Candidatus Bathyarchaeota archaeon]